jgi:hypothetical protein
MKCLIPQCDSEGSTRGLCHGCYTNAARAVKHKKVTWATLIANGLALDAKFKTGRRSKFQDALNAIIGQEAKP